MALNGDVRIWMLMLDGFENVIDDGGELHGTEIEARGAREIEKAGDEGIEAIHFRADVAGQFARERIGSFDFLAEHFRGAFDNAERIADFVSEAGGKLS